MISNFIFFIKNNIIVIFFITLSITLLFLLTHTNAKLSDYKKITLNEIVTTTAHDPSLTNKLYGDLPVTFSDCTITDITNNGKMYEINNPSSLPSFPIYVKLSKRGQHLAAELKKGDKVTCFAVLFKAYPDYIIFDDAIIVKN